MDFLLLRLFALYIHVFFFTGVVNRMNEHNKMMMMEKKKSEKRSEKNIIIWETTIRIAWHEWSEEYIEYLR